MKSTKLLGLCRCPECQSDNVMLMQNALKRFQVRCLDCGFRTRYKRKVEAVIDWFNLRLTLVENTPMKRGRPKEREASI